MVKGEGESRGKKIKKMYLAMNRYELHIIDKSYEYIDCIQLSS